MIKSILNSSLYKNSNDETCADCEIENFNDDIQQVNEPNSHKPLQIEKTFDTFFEDHEKIEINNATVCMIDICGFSKWCSNQIPENIVHVMSEYNVYLSKMIDQYKSLTKIELVGDCCMVVGGLTDNISKNESTLEIIRFAVNILQNLNEIHKIFTDKHIGLRIGIHISNVFGIMMSNPRRFQLYGNDINVCSRLESSTIKNTIHISLKTIMVTQGLCNSICGPCAHCIRSTMLNNDYKGVGQIQSFKFHVKHYSLLWYHEINIQLKPIMKFFDAVQNTKVINDMPYFLEQIYSFFWDHVVIFVNSQENISEIYKHIYNFRLWEKRRMPQNITVIVSNNIDSSIIEDICTVITFCKNQSIDSLCTTLKDIIKDKRNIDKSRSSLDLSI